MRQSYSKISVPSQSEHETPWSALVLLLVSYALILIAPLVFQMLRSYPLPANAFASAPAWTPVLAAGGLALAGGAAMIVVLVRMVRAIERQPYASLAAVLGVLMGVVLIALRAPLVVGNVDSGALAVIGLLTSIAAGAVVPLGGAVVATVGVLLALLPGPLLVAYLWTQEIQGTSLMTMFAGLDAASRTFLVLLTLGSVLMAIAALIGRALTRSARLAGEWSAEGADALPQRAPSTRVGRTVEVQDSWVASRLSAPRMNVQSRSSSALPSEAVLEPLDEVPPPGFSVWSLYDVDESRPSFWSRLRSWPVMLVIVLLASAAGGAAAWWFTRT